MSNIVAININFVVCLVFHINQFFKAISIWLCHILLYIVTPDIYIFTEQAGTLVTPLTCIWDVFTSNLGQHTGNLQSSRPLLGYYLRPRQHPFMSFPMYHSSPVLPFSMIGSSYWQYCKITHYKGRKNLWWPSNCAFKIQNKWKGSYNWITDNRHNSTSGVFTVSARWYGESASMRYNHVRT